MAHDVASFVNFRISDDFAFNLGNGIYQFALIYGCQSHTQPLGFFISSNLTRAENVSILFNKSVNELNQVVQVFPLHRTQDNFSAILRRESSGLNHHFCVLFHDDIERSDFYSAILNLQSQDRKTPKLYDVKNYVADTGKK